MLGRILKDLDAVVDAAVSHWCSRSSASEEIWRPHAGLEGPTTGID